MMSRHSAAALINNRKILICFQCVPQFYVPSAELSFLPHSPLPPPLTVHLDALGNDFSLKNSFFLSLDFPSHSASFMPLEICLSTGASRGEKLWRTRDSQSSFAITRAKYQRVTTHEGLDMPSHRTKYQKLQGSRFTITLVKISKSCKG